MGGWRGDRGSYIVSPKPASPSCKGRLGRLPRGGAGDPKGHEQGAANAGMGAFRVDQRSNVRGSRLRIRSPFRKKEKEESRRSFIFAYEREPLEKGEEERDEKVEKEQKEEKEEEEGLLSEEYAAMIEKKEKKMAMEEKVVETIIMKDVHLEDGVGTDGEGVMVTESNGVELNYETNKGDTSAEEFGSYAIEHGEHLNIVHEDCLPEEGGEGDGNNMEKDQEEEADSDASSAMSVETAREVFEGGVGGEERFQTGEEDHGQEDGGEDDGGEEDGGGEDGGEEKDLEVNGCQKQDEDCRSKEEEKKEEAAEDEGSLPADFQVRSTKTPNMTVIIVNWCL